MKLLFSALGFVAGALFVSAGRRTPSTNSTPVKVPVVPVPVNEIMPGTVPDRQITFTPSERYNASKEIPDDVVDHVARILKNIDEFTQENSGPYYAGPVPDDYQTQMEKKIDEAIIRQIIQERKQHRAA